MASYLLLLMVSVSFFGELDYPLSLPTVPQALMSS